MSLTSEIKEFALDLGYAAVGEPYDEDSIPHLEMLRS